MSPFVSGQWYAYNRVLALLQTYDKKLVDKRVVYKDIFELRPKEKEDT